MGKFYVIRLKTLGSMAALADHQCQRVYWAQRKAMPVDI
jgi:hypothetical protein